ncbi:MAG: GMP synthase [Bacteroidetes bacterium]|nr:MAG: GMP synthase [Bacteroidota bacterium]
MIINPTVAILDMNEGVANQGARCIRELVDIHNTDGQKLDYQMYDIRCKNEIPNINNHDIYISTGGPGSPFAGVGKTWERDYFVMLEKLWAHNQNQNARKKYFFFVCYSYQMMCRFFELATVSERNKTSFGLFPVYKTDAGEQDYLLDSLPDPYFAVDSRDWQLVQPRYENIVNLGAVVLSLEKIRPHVDYERALMAMRVSDEFVGTQFHPEAEPVSMAAYFSQQNKRDQIIESYGQEKYESMITLMKDPEKVNRTHETIIPSFLRNAIQKLQVEDKIFA